MVEWGLWKCDKLAPSLQDGDSLSILYMLNFGIVSPIFVRLVLFLLYQNKEIYYKCQIGDQLPYFHYQGSCWKNVYIND